jgi:hypothetical protein
VRLEDLPGFHTKGLNDRDWKIWNNLWAFDIKTDGKGNFLGYKARLCFQGQHMKEGVDHSAAEIYTSILRIQTLRVVMSFYLQLDPNGPLEIGNEIWDVKTAFVRAILHKFLLMRVPPGVAGWEGKVLKLMTSLYGLPTAHKYWDEFLKAILLDLGFVPSPADPKLYSLRRKNAQGHVEMFDIPLYVDDMPVHWRGRELRDWVLKSLQDKGLILKVGPLDKVLGMTVTTDWQKGIIAMSQRPAKEFLLEVSGHVQKKKRSTPMKPGLVLDQVLEPSTLEDRMALTDFEYRTFLGKIGDLCLRTCPQYITVFSNLARHATDPRLIHRQAMEWLFDYMVDDLDTELVYRRYAPENMACKIVHFSDSSFADDRITAKSQGCGLGFVYGNLVWWLSRRQASVATSTFMAEVMARFENGKEIAHQRELLKGLGDPETGPSLIWQDNIASAIFDVYGWG